MFEQVVAQQLGAAGQVASFSVEQVDGLGAALPATVDGDNPSALSVLGQQLVVLGGLLLPKFARPTTAWCSLVSEAVNCHLHK